MMSSLSLPVRGGCGQPSDTGTSLDDSAFRRRQSGRSIVAARPVGAEIEDGQHVIAHLRGRARDADVGRSWEESGPRFRARHLAASAATSRQRAHS